MNEFEFDYWICDVCSTVHEVSLSTSVPDCIFCGAGNEKLMPFNINQNREPLP